jgi:hypothetical protein
MTAQTRKAAGTPAARTRSQPFDPNGEGSKAAQAAATTIPAATAQKASRVLGAHRATTSATTIPKTNSTMIGLLQNCMAAGGSPAHPCDAARRQRQDYDDHRVALGRPTTAANRQ